MQQAIEGPGCTPTVDGGRLYVLGMGGDLACPAVKDGKILWQHSLTREFGGQVPMWSYRESPLVDGNKVICTPGGQDAILVALRQVDWEDDLEEQVAGRCRSQLRPWAWRARQIRWSRLRVSHRNRLRGAAAVRATHIKDARGDRGVRRKVSLAL
jgi:hypothetical protein